MSIRARSWVLDGLWAGLLGLLVMAPVVGSRGYTLRGDMVFVPDQPWKPAWLGLDGGVPRAVPSDALTWLAGTVLPGDVVQKLVLVLSLVLAGVGTARLVRALVGTDEGPLRAWVVTAAPVALVMWNPYVYGRLSIGHWALLCGYAALPWVVLLARGCTPLLVVVPVALAAWTSPTGGVIATVVAVAVLAVAQPRRRALVVSGLVVVLNLPWVLPGLLAPAASGAGASAGVEAFAARGDTPFGDVGSLLSFGGLWKASVDAPGRDDWLLSGAALVLTAAGVAGLVALARRPAPSPAPSPDQPGDQPHDRPPGRAVAVVLGALAAAGLLLAWLPTTAAGQDLMGALGGLPGGGLLRDSQKWLALAILPVAVGLGEAARRWLPQGRHGTFWGVAVAVLPLAVLPGLAWGLAGTFDNVDYPDEWSQVRGLLDEADAADERTVVLPFSVYRRFPWNEEVAVLDPAPRFFPGDVVVDDALPVRGGVVPGESEVATRIRDTAGSADRLAAVLAEEGVRFVLVERSAPGGQDTVVPPGEVVHDGDDLTLLDLGHEGEPRRLGRSAYALVVAGDVAALVVLVAGAAAALGRRRRTAGDPARSNHD